MQLRTMVGLSELGRRWPGIVRLAPPELSRGLELQRGSDPGIVERAVPAWMNAYKAIPEITEIFGCERPDLEGPGPFRVPGYLVAAHAQSYVHPMLISSALGSEGFGALIELRVPPGAPALWIPGRGDPSTIAGADMIALESPTLEVTVVRDHEGKPLICADVTYP